MDTNSIESAMAILNNLNNKLREIEKKQNTGLNLFYATGMFTQEIKHSAFLAWLLDPKQAHGLHNMVLTKLAEKLNLQIDGFLNADDIEVKTEQPIDDIGGRIDIFIQSEKARTAIIIENKVFTTTHDNQLSRYERYVENRTDWQKIFIYLTPKGEVPLEQSENAWLLLSYGTVLEIINELLKTKISLKLKYILTDYTEMVNLNILLKNNDIRKLCRQIKREHSEALEILAAYTDNVEQVFKYCKDWLKNNIPDIEVVLDCKTYFNFYTKNLKTYFLNNGEDIALTDKLVKCRYGIGYTETVAGGISLEKNSEEWSNAQLKLKNAFAPDREFTSKYFSFRDYAVVLLSVKDRELEFEKIKEDLDKQLSEFANKIKEFEEKLIALE